MPEQSECVACGRLVLWCRGINEYPIDVERADDGDGVIVDGLLLFLGTGLAPGYEAKLPKSPRYKLHQCPEATKEGGKP